MTSNPHRLSDAEIQHFIDTKTKPLGALGRIESLAAQLARFCNTLTPRIETCELVIFAADHGIALEGVSAFPQAVTQQMVQNFLAGGAAANVFAHSQGVPVHVVDAGVAGEPIDAPDLWSHRIAPGTPKQPEWPRHDRARPRPRPCRRGRDRCAHLCPGAGLRRNGDRQHRSASLLAHKLTGLALDDLVGRGTGVDDAGLCPQARDSCAGRPRAPTPAASPTRPCQNMPVSRMVMMAGAMQAAAEDGRIVLVDGFIATAMRRRSTGARAAYSPGLGVLPPQPRSRATVCLV